MYSYLAFELRIKSDLLLPELMSSGGGRPDVTIRLGDVAENPNATHFDGIFRYHITRNDAFFFWDGIAAFHVRSGNEIVVDVHPGAEEQMIRILLLGAVFAVLLHQRGLLVLHASAIAINDGAVAFIGSKGRGKSTMAATLYARGHHLLADDAVVLSLNGEEPMVPPGFPQIKLWPAAAAASLGENPETLPRVAPGFEKRARYTRERFSQKPLPLKAIYVLDEGPVTECIPVRPQEAITQLIGNSHIARFGKQVLKGTEASSHLRQCAYLASTVPMFRLKRPNSLALLPDIATLVEQQVGHCPVRIEVDPLPLALSL